MIYKYKINWVGIIGLLFLSFSIIILCHSPLFSNGFLYSWDDQWMVINKFTERGWSLDNLITVFTKPYKAQFSPLVQLNYIFIYSLFGYNPFWFHFISIVWHYSCTFLVFFFIYRILTFSNQTDQRTAFLVAYFTSFLFAIHPINVESIAWISAVKIPMYVFFYVFALLIYLKYVSSQKIIFYILTIFCFLLSVLCKEQAILLPIALLLTDWFLGRNLGVGRLWLDKLPFFIISIIFIVLTLKFANNETETIDYTVFQRFLFGSYSLFEYITKSIIPFNLSYLYPFPILKGSTEISIRFYFYPLLIMGLMLCLLYFRKNKILIFGCLFFIIHLLLVLHIIPIHRYGIIADRYAYLSLVGLFMVIVYFIITWIINKKKILFSVLFGILFVLYSFYLGVYTYQYSYKWKNTFSVKEYLWKIYNK